MTLAGKVVLVVDDEFAIAETLRDLLDDADLKVVLAGNGREALERMAVDRPALVLTDLMMPILGGIELVTQMRADPALREIPVIMMSSAPRAASVKAALEAGTISSFFRKPFDLAALLAEIERLIGSK